MSKNKTDTFLILIQNGQTQKLSWKPSLLQNDTVNLQMEMEKKHKACPGQIICPITSNTVRVQEISTFKNSLEGMMRSCSRPRNSPAHNLLENGRLLPIVVASISYVTLSKKDKYSSIVERFLLDADWYQ